MMMIDKICPGFTIYLKPQEGHGCEFWIVIRALLDRCKDVYEARCLLEEIDIRTNANIMVADVSNNASIFEIANFSSNKKKITERKPVGDLILTTNHYVSNEMKEFDEYHFWHSKMRYTAVWNIFIAGSTKR
ncbi:carcinine hydrolase/isopenicillin-N N-acyltransferase family protein [Paenibacillus sp. GYB004]|uniref:carcinine hydrolase/isopenicillin-N N-acyltransferase family protein n=1 Tax=Paenibacillus sp. GYB004 TaxID=2994393 RepID=UPI002F96493F